MEGGSYEQFEGGEDSVQPDDMDDYGEGEGEYDEEEEEIQFKEPELMPTGAHNNVSSWTTVPTDNLTQMNQDWDNEMGKGAAGKNFSQKFMKIVMNEPNEQKWLEYVGVSGLDLENTNIETEEDVVALKRGLRLHFPLFMANIVKILLFRGEEKLCCLLTAYFEVALDMEMFKCAV